jgi:hypothetical protein
VVRAHGFEYLLLVSGAVAECLTFKAMPAPAFPGGLVIQQSAELLPGVRRRVLDECAAKRQRRPGMPRPRGSAVHARLKVSVECDDRGCP